MNKRGRQRICELAREIHELANQSTYEPDAAQGGGGIDPEFLKALAAVHQAPEPKVIAEIMTKIAVQFAGGEFCFIMLVTEEQKLRFAAGENVTAGQLAGAVPVARQVIQTSLQNAELVADDYENRSVVCVPIVSFPNGDSSSLVKMGLLYLDRAYQEEPVSDMILEMLESLVDHGATSLSNLRKQGVKGIGAMTSASPEEVERLKEQLEELNKVKSNLAKLTEIGKEISSTLDMNSLFTKIVDYVVDLSGAQRGFLMLVENNEPVYKVGRTSRGQTIPVDHFQFSRSVTHKCITEKKPQFLVVSSDDGFDPSRSIVAMQLKSVMCMPLMEKGDVLGLVYLDSQTTAKEFDESDANLLQSLCGQAAVALLNAKLLNQATEKERIRSELDLASKIQLGLLPKKDPEVNGLEVRGRMIPAKEVGGDYYDFIPHLDTKDSLTVAIGDVSGKGVGAGLVMIMARSIIRSAVSQAGVPNSTVEIMRNLNSIFCDDLRRGTFMTVLIANWDDPTSTITYTGAGHEHVIIYRAADRSIEAFRAGGVATGVLKTANNMYKESSFQLNEGDQVLLYTDGVTEAMNEANDEWGLDELKNTVAANGDKTPLDLINSINQAIARFVGTAEQHDDITMVAMKAKPKLFQSDISGDIGNVLDMFED